MLNRFEESILFNLFPNCKYSSMILTYRYLRISFFSKRFLIVESLESPKELGDWLNGTETINLPSEFRFAVVTKCFSQVSCSVAINLEDEFPQDPKIAIVI